MTKDARIARDVAIDELKTTNKYEALAEAADSKKVKDVVNDIAREEKVHTGEAAALLDDVDPEAKDAMKEGVEEVRSFQESDDKETVQARFEGGKVVAPLPKPNGPLKYEVNPEAYERQRRYKKSVGPTFAEIFANERGRVLEKTGMMSDEGLDGFKKGMIAKAGDFSISRDMYEYSPTRGRRLIEENVGTNWPMPGVSSDHLLNPRGGDQEYNEVLHSSGRLHSPQQRDIALNHPPIGRMGKTPEQSHSDREKKYDQRMKEKEIEEQYKSGKLKTEEVEQPTVRDINAQNKDTQTRNRDKKGSKRTPTTDEKKVQLAREKDSAENEHNHGAYHHLRDKGQFMSEGDSLKDNEREGWHVTSDHLGTAPKAESSPSTDAAFEQVKNESPSMSDGVISVGDRNKMDRLVQENLESAPARHQAELEARAKADEDRRARIAQSLNNIFGEE